MEEAMEVEDVPSTWNYREIDSVIYHGDLRILMSAKLEEQCLCPEGILKCSTDDCPNRAMFVECPPSCGVYCGNQKIQKREWIKGLQRILTQDKGYGIFTSVQIKKGSFIAEYVGEVVTKEEFEHRMNTLYSEDVHHYCFDLGNGLIIDGQRVGNEIRFINHSCDPNCKMVKWSINGLPRLALFAEKDIESGEELTYDYHFTHFQSAEPQRCFCKSFNCRGVIGVPDGSRNSTTEVTKDPQSSSSESCIRTLIKKSQQEMKPISKKNRDFIHSKRCFLLTNYDKIKQSRQYTQAIADKLEKLVKPWTLRHKPGSSRNIPLQIPEDDPKLVILARKSELLYEAFVKIATLKDEHGNELCKPCINSSTSTDCPQHFSSCQATLDFSEIVRKIVRGQFQSISSFEVHMRKILSSSKNFNPDMTNNIKKVNDIFEELKSEAKNQFNQLKGYKSFFEN